jgi:hypothetical protein
MKCFGRSALRILMMTSMLGGAAGGCRKMASDDQAQIGAAVGEAMAGLDESVQGGGTAVLRRGVPVLNVPDDLKGPMWRRALERVIPSAYAASCWVTPLSACSGGVRTRTFDHCTLGAATLDGMTTLNFNRPASCVLATAGDSVTRVATLTLTGLYGGTLEVTSPGGGQTVTKTAAGFEYSVGGMQRVLKGPGGRTLFDVGTRTTTPIAVTGTSRANLVITSGAFEIEHHLAGYKVTLVPQNLTWSASCNCAVSGNLTGAVAGGPLNGKAASVTVTGCGRADLTIDGDTESITLDRCAGI